MRKEHFHGAGGAPLLSAGKDGAATPPQPHHGDTHLSDYTDSQHPPHTLLIASGGTGASAELLVHTALAQFPEERVRVVTVPNLRYTEQIDELIAHAGKTHATIVHTLVDANLRAYLTQQAQQQGITAIDLMGALLTHLAEKLGRQPLGQPGLYRLLRKSYFDRVAAIEYAMAHDDGKDPANWHQADIVLSGVSRSGKTPLSLYLSVLGWKVANVPIVPGLDLPDAFFKLDRQRVIGLTIEAGQLALLRQQRQRHLGVSELSEYTSPQKVFEEVEYAMDFFKRQGISTVDVTDKPIESSAEEIIRIITRRFGGERSR